jgi:N-acetylmuramoyl-L-alanine amidase
MLPPPIEVPTVQQVYFSLSEEEQDNLPVESKASIAGMTEAEYKLLSAVVEAESDRKKGSIEGRVMIAIVILNRVDSKSFPNTITKVLKQRGQFAVVTSGAYKRVGRTKLSDRAVIEAVRRKKAGTAPKVLYFRAGHYFKGRKRYAKVGDNYFSY